VLFRSSIGAGTYRDRSKAGVLRRAPSATLALRAMVQQIGDNQQLILTLMSWFGESALSWPINEETGDLALVPAPTGPLFRFLRYDLKLEPAWLKNTLGSDVSEPILILLRRFDDPSAMQMLEDLGKRAAQVQVREADWATARP
jgi:uncharacterized protein